MRFIRDYLLYEPRRRLFFNSPESHRFNVQQGLLRYFLENPPTFRVSSLRLCFKPGLQCCWRTLLDWPAKQNRKEHKPKVGGPLGNHLRHCSLRWMVTAMEIMLENICYYSVINVCALIPTFFSPCKYFNVPTHPVGYLVLGKWLFFNYIYSRKHCLEIPCEYEGIRSLFIYIYPRIFPNQR